MTFKFSQKEKWIAVSSGDAVQRIPKASPFIYIFQGIERDYGCFDKYKITFNRLLDMYLG